MVGFTSFFPLWFEISLNTGGVEFSRRICGVSIIRSGEAMENALRTCCIGVARSSGLELVGWVDLGVVGWLVYRFTTWDFMIELLEK